MRGSVVVASVESEHTTARYFARAVAARGDRGCTYATGTFALDAMGPDDLLLCVDPVQFLPLGLERARCTTAAYLIDVHQALRFRVDLSRLFDVVFVAQRDYVEAFTVSGHPRASWLPLACDDEIHCAPGAERPFEVGFVGTLGPRNSARHRLLTDVLPRFRTNDFFRYHAPREMAEVYGRSRIVLNASINGDVNMRVFEAMAAGALLVTDRIGNGLLDLFQDGVHCLVYDGAADAAARIEQMLANDQTRETIAREGQRAVLAHHTYRHRWASIEAATRAAQGLAPARSMSSPELAVVYSDAFLALRRPASIVSVARMYGATAHGAAAWAKAVGRKWNARVPFTPNAIRARLNRPSSGRASGKGGE